MIGHEAIVAGGGPTGLMLAAELALAGIDVAVVEKRASQELAGSRACNRDQLLDALHRHGRMTREHELA